MSDTPKIHTESVFPPFVRPYYNPPLRVKSAKGVRITDESGHSFLDCYAGVATVALGHCHPTVDGAVKTQIDQFGHISALYESPIQLSYAEKLLRVCQRGLSDGNQQRRLTRAYFVNSGSEAVDLGISLARVTAGTQDVVALKESYHGGSYLSKTATGLKTWHFHAPDAPDFSWVQSPFDNDTARISLKEIQTCFDKTKANGGRPIFIMEPVLGVGGIVVPPPAFFEGLKALINDYHGLLLLDEVQTGFGRCGDTIFACEKFGLEPDILMLGKGIANGYPLGATIMSEEVAQANNELLHFSTFGGNAASIAAATVVLDIIDNADFLRGVTVRGETFRGILRETLRDCPKVKAIRGVGYMTGVEVISAEVASIALTVCYDEGLLIGMGGREKNVIRLQPALIFSNEDYEKAGDILSKVLHSIPE